MPKVALTLEEKLAKFKMTHEFYGESSQKFRELGYTEEQIDRIVFRPSSKNTIKKLLELHDDLIKHFSCTQLAKIAAHNGGSKNLEAVKNCFDALRVLGFEATSIEKMVAHIGGSKNLEAVKSCFDALRALGFEAISIEKMVAHDGGSKNLEAVKSCFDALRALGFEATSIERMVAHHG
ncbi:MAG: hypothetical protein WA253_05150, partial [Gammaproteobacteria bacterium]